MANLPEANEYPAGIYQIETTDPVLGGPPNEATKAGLTNIPPMQLAKRTHWLKIRVDQLLAKAIAGTTLVAGLVRLSNAVNSTSEAEAATSRAVKSANDNAETRALKATSITTSGLATGGGSLAQDREVGVPAATQAEAVAGETNTKAMTPLRVRQAIAASFAQNLNAYGYTVMPNGLILQWGRFITDANGLGSVLYPIAFPTAAFQVILGDWSDNLDLSGSHTTSVSSVTRTGFDLMPVRWDGLRGASAVPWFAIGR